MVCIFMTAEPEGKFEAEICNADPQQAINCTVNTGYCIITYYCASFNDCFIPGHFKCDGLTEPGIQTFTHWEICHENSKENCTLQSGNRISLMKILQMKNESFQKWTIKCFGRDFHNFTYPNIKAFNFSLILNGIFKFFVEFYVD